MVDSEPKIPIWQAVACVPLMFGVLLGLPMLSNGLDELGNMDTAAQGIARMAGGGALLFVCGTTIFSIALQRNLFKDIFTRN